MDELMTVPQENSYDISADGVANTGYEEETLELSPEGASPPDSEEVISEDGVKLDVEGELTFGEKFFGEMPGQAEDAPPAVKLYTDEELDSIPFQQWDLSRLTGDVGKYARKVQEQLQRERTRQNEQRWENIPLPSDIVEVKAYTPKELSEEALKLACEKLGITETEDFDSYEMEHQSAYQLSLQELMQKRNAEMSAYQVGNQTWQENNRYQASLMSRPDFDDFNRYVEAQCQKRGTTIGEVNAYLYQLARQNGNNFRVVSQFIESLYQEYRAQKGTPPKDSVVSAGMKRVPRTPAPAVLESTGGNTYAGKGRINARAFRGMNADEQEEALMRLGLV